MQDITEITPQQAWQMMRQENAVLADIRDLLRFNYSHAEGAFHLTQQSYNSFQDQFDYDQPIIVSCYHGISSRGAAAFLTEQGYDRVYSLRGGFEAWVNAGLPLTTAYTEKPTETR
ncbi:thiosulfate sulfurtransferase [Mesocricetibacter intestinalis]|uniref:Thiosulfate sulfurtransferase GlpE n=1 Tax=Mesocricetibacter intestinalis TaxID=1521930 RepID=A0A4R6VB22_9PAST|nr:thiosulfate sulfurtransferase GlpE [Mesocricetibacter intestinalis]TDQ59357.1 thiosulfate sulfurtransferase [Mesocricetibacter intestinalis]